MGRVTGDADEHRRAGPAGAPMSTGWRYACPNGHVTLVYKRGNHVQADPSHRWYCQTCSQGYDQVKDKKTGAWVHSKPDD